MLERKLQTGTILDEHEVMEGIDDMLAMVRRANRSSLLILGPRGSGDESQILETT
jgi:hypothetical protein